MAGFTVEDLRRACDNMIQQGKGNRTVYISQDDEGNGFHQLLFLFTDDTQTIDSYGFNSMRDILLG